MTFQEILSRVEKQCKTLVWWSPDQIARGEDVLNDPKKGERPWAVPRETAEFLADMVRERKPWTILELGTSIGYSTLWIANAAAEYGGHVHTVELRPYKYEIAQQNIRDAGLEKNVTFYNSSIHDMLTQVEGWLAGQKIDLVFMDADRGHYHEYFPLLEPHLAYDCRIVADNAINMRARMQPFLDMLHEKNWRLTIFQIDNGVLVAEPTLGKVKPKE